ncbi:MAG: archaeosortase/exosortase family protein [Candidatus Diapherotrites archaeon]|jgi:exosortase/archaeosortase family protein|nr:archaeosortase/exosortase family protein [Candidatus Diapherotrites archaeon]MBT4596447.1 archaeosortase/exosortase family protein [Candidatus Diapherotrites archaeon]
MEFKKIQKKFNSNKPAIVFLIKFFIIYFVLSTIISLLDLSLITNYLAMLTASMLGLEFIGNIIFVDSVRFIITNYCTGLMSGAILASIIFALKRPELKQKLLLFLFGFCLLLIINIPRLLLVLVSAKVGFDAEIVHTITWFVMSGIILVIWYYGTKSITKNDFNKLLN